MLRWTSSNHITGKSHRYGTTFGMGRTWEGGLNFSHVQSMEKYNTIHVICYQLHKNYDELGLDWMDPVVRDWPVASAVRIRGMNSLAKSAAPGAVPAMVSEMADA